MPIDVSTAAAASAVARLVPCGRESFVALPAHTTLEIVERPHAVPVPGAPAHALGLLQWQGKRIALIDLDVLVGASQAVRTTPRYALVLAFQRAPGAPLEHGAVALDALPQTISVTDDSACELPAGSVRMRLATACFRHEGLPVPVLDSASLFV